MNQIDQFLNFTYNGVHSSEFGIFYTNSGEDLFFPFATVSSHQITSPLYQNRSYWMGSSIEAKQFSLTLATEKQSTYSAQQIMQWLDPTVPGELVFDYMPNYVYKVLITRVDNPTTIPFRFPNGFIENILIFQVIFTTYKRHLAETRHTYVINSTTAARMYEPDTMQLMFTRDGNKVRFVNLSKVNQTIKLYLQGTEIEVIKKEKSNTDTWYRFSLPSSEIVQIDSEVGAAVIGGKLLEAKYPNAYVINKGPLNIKSGLVFSGEVDVTVSGAQVTVPIDGRFQGIASSSSYVLVTEPKWNKDSSLAWLEEEDRTGYYPTNESELPIYLNGTLSGQSLIFSNTAENTLSEGRHKVKIATVTEIEVSRGTWSMEFNYRKGV